MGNKLTEFFGEEVLRLMIWTAVCVAVLVVLSLWLVSPTVYLP